VLTQWLRNARDCGLGVGNDLIDQLGTTGVADNVARADSLLCTLETTGKIKRIKWYPSFSRRVFLGLESSGAQQGEYTYPCDWTWEVLPGALL
jgi:hypothetical protein